MSHRTSHVWMLGVALLMGVGGCMVGPDYQPATVDMNDRWRESGAAGLSAESAEEALWWTTFNDPVLDQLIETAYAQNLDLKVAGLRVLEARANRGIAEGDFFPQTQQATGQYNAIATSEDVANPAFRDDFEQVSVGLDVVWEVDVWGRFRRGIESADASLYASVMDYDDVLVSLTGEVATAYVDIRSLDQRLAYANENVEIQRYTLRVAEVLFKYGETSELDVQQARSNLANTEALVPTLYAQRRSAVNRLCVLMGMMPQDLDQMLGDSVGVPRPPANVAVGAPAELLRRRPDIRRAERQAAAQSAQIGVAESALYPHFTLNGSIGYEAENVGDLFTGSAMIGSFGPAFRWDILNYGRIMNAVRVQDARFEQALIAYQSVVLQAASEVESASTSYLRSQQQADALGQSVEATRRAVDIALIQYRNGEVDFIRVVDTQSFLVDQQDRLASSRRDIAANLITLYRAMGGGWALREGNTFVDTATRDRMTERTNWGDVIDDEALLDEPMTPARDE